MPSAMKNGRDSKLNGVRNQAIVGTSECGVSRATVGTVPAGCDTAGNARY